MKRKMVSLIMAAAMVFTLISGCGNSDKPKESSSQGATNAAQTKDAQTEAKDIVETKAADNGGGKKITALFFSLEGEYFTILDNCLKKELEARGYTYASQSSNFDAVTMIEQIENAVAGGTDAIWLWPTSALAVADACKAAKDAGVLVYSFVQDVGEDARDVFRGSDEAECGRSIGKLAIQYADEKYGKDAQAGSIKTVLIGSNSSTESKERYDALQEVIKTDARFEVLEAVGIELNTVEAQTTAENMYSKYGDIDCFINTGGEIALGVLAYITSDSSPVKDPTSIGVFGTEISEELANYIKQGIYKGTVVNGGIITENIAVQAEELDKLLKGEPVNSFSMVDMGLVTADNLSDYGY